MVKRFLIGLKRLLNDERGFLNFAIPAALGIAGYFAGRKGSKKRDTTPNIGDFSTPQSTQAGGALLPTLKSRAGGQGVAFTGDQLSQYYNPYAQAAQSQFQRHTLPALESAQGAANIAGTPQGVGQIAGARQDVADRNAMNWQDFLKWNEALKQQGISGALSGLDAFTAKELAQSNLSKQAQWQDYANQVNQASAQKTARAQVLPNAMISAGGAYTALNQPDYSEFFKSINKPTNTPYQPLADTLESGQRGVFSGSPNDPAYLRNRKRLNQNFANAFPGGF